MSPFYTFALDCHRELALNTDGSTALTLRKKKIQLQYILIRAGWKFLSLSYILTVLTIFIGNTSTEEKLSMKML